MIPQDIIEKAIKYIERGHSYPRPLPIDLVPWYVYLRDIGHAIVCRMKHLRPLEGEDVTNYMIWLPVRTVLSGYEMDNGVIVVDVRVDAEHALLIPDEDYEL